MTFSVTKENGKQVIVVGYVPTYTSFHGYIV